MEEGRKGGRKRKREKQDISKSSLGA